MPQDVRRIGSASRERRSATPPTGRIVRLAAWGLAGLGPAGIASGQDLLVSSRFSDNVLRYDGDTGQFLGVFASGHGMDNPNGIAFGPDGLFYAALGDVGKVLRFHPRSGAFLGEFVSGAGGLLACRAIAFGPDGHLHVCDGVADKVFRFDGATGAFLGFSAEGNGMDGPVGLTFGPSGNMFVGVALTNAVMEFTPQGSFVRSLIAPGHNNATGVLFDGQGRLYAAQSVTNAVVRFDVAAGVATDVFASGGGLLIPIGMIFTPAGDLLVGSFGNDAVLRYDGATGAFMGVFIATGSGGLDGTHNFAYVPCFADCDASTGAGVLDFFDFICFQDRFAAGHPYACDCDTSTGVGTCDFFDFICFQDAFGEGCP